MANAAANCFIIAFPPPQTFFSNQGNMDGRKGDDTTADGQQLGFVAGVIGRERVIGFERMLWRVSRGNVFLRQADIEKPFTDPKTVRLLCSRNVFA